MAGDLTRWNRAGLARFEYLDGNAAVWLERLRAGLADRLPGWDRVQPGVPVPADETEEARIQRLQALYASDPDDMLWQLLRQFARSCHVLGVHVDAYANEACLGTATQWENLRRLVALLDYAPAPPASASTPLALMLKDGLEGTVAAGLQVKHSPPSGAPVVFETLADLDANAALNTLYALDHARSPALLGGSTLVLEGRLDRLVAGEPLVLAHEASGALSAHLVQGLTLGDETTTVTVTPAIPQDARLRFGKGWTLVHVMPKEHLKPLAPATQGVDAAGHALQLSTPTGDLAPGDIVIVRSVDDKPAYRRLKAVHEDRLVFHRPLGALTLNGATVARPVTVPLTDLGEPVVRRASADGTVFHVVYAAGDWSRLASLWLSDLRKVKGSGGTREVLPLYHCLHAKYVPVDTDRERLEADDRPGYTALTLTWHPDTDGVAGHLNLALNNPQTLLAPPPGAGPWTVDRFLNKSADGRLTPEIVTGMAKQAAAGDLAVVVKGAQMAWARLASVASDAEHEESTLRAEGAWQDRGGGPFFLSRTRVHTHFAKQVRVLGWQDNPTPLGGTRVQLEPEATAVVAGLDIGRALVVDNGTSTIETELAGVAADGRWLDLADPLPAGTTAANLRIHGNVVRAGHGEARPARVLGSGDATRANQRFVLEVDDLSFVADATMRAGVRADLELTVAGETWQQVSNLKDSASTDAHYQVRIDEDGHAGIQFGDGRHGRRLPSGGNNLRVRFRQGVGLAGNLAPGSLVKLPKPHPLLASVAQPLAAAGGADREAAAALRTSAPATLLALDRAVSLDDFANLARGHASVWQAGAFRRPPGLSRRERIEVVVMAAGGGIATASLKAELQAYLLARAQPGLAISVVDYTPLSFQLAVTVRVRSESFDPETVASGVVAALQSAFSASARRLGQPLYRGEVYRVVDGVQGVENSDCRIVLPPATEGALQRVSLTFGEVAAAWPREGQCLLLAAVPPTVLVQEYAL